MAVRVKTGAMAFTLIPLGPHSMASEWVSWFTAPLLGA